MRTGILGGTFNPPHYGHLTAAKNAYEALLLDRVLFIPTNIPPHKQLPEDAASAHDRCEMVRRLIEPYPWAELSTLEIDRGGPSYTVDTLRELKKKRDDLFLIIGTDMLLSFHTGWRAPEEIASLCTLAVCARREGEDTVLLEQADRLRARWGAKIELVHGDVLDISSTVLRQGGNLSRYTPPAVQAYIREHHLYRKS